MAEEEETADRYISGRFELKCGLSCNATFEDKREKSGDQIRKDEMGRINHVLDM